MNETARTTAVRAISIAEVLRGMARRWKMIAGFAIGFAVLGAAFVAFSRPLYTSEAQILLEYQDSPYTRSPAAGGQPAPRQISDRDVRSQVAVLKSRDLALRVLRDLHLIGTPEFDVLKRGMGLGARLKVLLGFAPDPRRQTPEQRALTTWYKRLKAYNLPQTKLLVVEYSAHDPRTATAVADRLAKLYVQQTRRSRLQQTGEARAWLKEQIEKLRRKVVESEVAVERFRARAGLFQGTQSSLRNQELSELSSQIVKAAAERSRAQARARAIREMLKKGAVETSAEVLRSPLVQRLREQQVRLQRRLAELSTTYLENHPKVRAVRRELADLERQIRAEARKIAASLEQQAKIAASREAALRAALARLKAQASEASVNEVKLRELEREAKANRALLESFLARYTDASARDEEAALPGMARVISRAEMPSMPSFPRSGPILILATLAGLMLGLGLAFVMEVMAASSRLARAEDEAAQAASLRAGAGSVRPAPAAPAMTGAAMTGATAQAAPQAASDPVPQADEALSRAVRGTASPKPGGREDETPATDVPPRTSSGQGEDAEGPVGAQDFSAAVGLPELVSAAAARELALTAVKDPQGPYARALAPALKWLEQGRARGRKVIAVAAMGGLCADAAGAALALARLAAADGRRVVVVDADLKGRCLGAATGGGGGSGFSDLLAGQASFTDIVARDAVSGVHLIHAGAQGEEAGRLLSAPLAAQAVEALGQIYDLVLMLEGESMYPADAARSALPLCQGAIILAREEDAGLAEALAGALRRGHVGPSLFIRLTPVSAAAATSAAASGSAGKERRAALV